MGAHVLVPEWWNIVVKVRLRMRFVAANAALVRKTTVVVLALAACSACSPALAPQNAAPAVLDVIQAQPVQRLAKTVWQDVSHIQASLRASAAKLADFRPAGLRLVTLVLMVRSPRLALTSADPVALGALLLQGVLFAQSAKRDVILEEDRHSVAPARLAGSLQQTLLNYAQLVREDISQAEEARSASIVCRGVCLFLAVASVSHAPRGGMTE